MADRETLGAHEIRRRFVEFFTGRGHTHVPSSSLVPHADPTLLFVNAGMVQFKDVFLGREQRPYSRAVTVQRCMRAGGKHNDLDNVGFTPRHHTLFEMLGNFSFGDYFKRDAIKWGWEFLTGPVDEGCLGLAADRLVATVYDGRGENAPADDEAYELWTEWLPPTRIYRCSAKENFWMMGDTGPCGPCSEIHVFNGERAPGLATTAGPYGPAHEDDKYMELWNLVFMQYEKREGGLLVPLPKPSVDTGAGLERIACTAANVASTYETELLAPLVHEAVALAHAPAEARFRPAFRVIADHARATAFLVADGVFPDRAGRSYVLRRIMRRAIRHGTEVGLDEPFLHLVCRKVVELFGAVYPELRERAATIEEVVLAEEQAFRRTLDRGLRRLRAALTDIGDREQFPPAIAADLYDTYGFPIDLTRVICGEHGIALDEAAAEDEVRQRQSAGENRELGQERAVADVYFAVQRMAGDSEFLGYEGIRGQGVVRAILAGGKLVERASAPADVELVFDRTPFYAESGGQVGDTGLVSGSGVRVDVLDVHKPVGNLHVHRGRLTQGTVAVGQSLELEVDGERRDAIRRNHSATHLLHLALRSIVGPHVVQKGSLVAPDRLRFDYSHNRPLTVAQRREVERVVNHHIVQNRQSGTRIMSPAGAREAGAIGLFGEKYGDQVRVVTIGDQSTELCGGTHVERAGDIGFFAIIEDVGIAQGVRRIEAVTGLAAVEWVQELAETIDVAAASLHAGSTREILERIRKLQDELRASERRIADLQRKLATGGGSDEPVVAVGGVKLLVKRVPVADAKALREAADALRNKLGTGVVVLGAESDGKATLLVAVTRDLADRVHAGRLVGDLAHHVGGRGGGRPDLAQAGGPNAAGLDAALGAASLLLKQQLGAS